MPEVTCPKCGATLNAPESLLGKPVTCGGCGQVFVAGRAAPPAGPPPEQAPAPEQPPGPGQPPPPVAPPPAQEAPPPGQVPPPYAAPGAPQYYPPAQAGPGTSGMSIASLVLGIAAIPTCMCYGFPAILCGILALVFGAAGKRAVNEGRAGGNSAGLARAGMICGGIGIALAIIFWVVIIIAIVVGAMQAPPGTF